jgi:hypothetical protein
MACLKTQLRVPWHERAGRLKVRNGGLGTAAWGGSILPPPYAAPSNLGAAFGILASGLGLLRGSYFFFSFFIFLLISSISFGFNSASTLSTILAMTADSDGPASDAVSAGG